VNVQGEVMLQEVVSVGIENSVPSVRISAVKPFPFRRFVTMEPLQSTLLAHLSQVPDFRHARGQRFAWSYLLALVAAAVAAGQTSVLAMVSWAHAHAGELYSTLQPACPRIPSAATWRRLLIHIDLAALEQQVAAYNQVLDQADALSGAIAMQDGQRWRGQAVDGKDVRGASAHGAHTFLVSLVRHDSAYVLGQQAVDVKTNEITVVPALLAGRDLTATVTTMDALLTQRHLAQQILDQHGHYLMIIKKNQPTLYWAADLVFREPPVPARAGELLTSKTENKDHGRLETRSLTSTTALNEYLTWPGMAQVLRRSCRRRNLRTGHYEIEVTYGLTSLPRTLAGPTQLAQIWRAHWTIENRLHYVRDETLGEDRCQVHTGAAPQALAAIRNAVLSLLRFHGWSNIAAAARNYASQPQRALRLLGVPAL
jgi:predicted transposase YbfD/YdcC